MQLPLQRATAELGQSTAIRHTFAPAGQPFGHTNIVYPYKAAYPFAYSRHLQDSTRKRAPNHDPSRLRSRKSQIDRAHDHHLC